MIARLSEKFQQLQVTYFNADTSFRLCYNDHAQLARYDNPSVLPSNITKLYTLYRNNNRNNFIHWWALLLKTVAGSLRLHRDCKSTGSFKVFTYTTKKDDSRFMESAVLEITRGTIYNAIFSVPRAVLQSEAYIWTPAGLQDQTNWISYTFEGAQLLAIRFLAPCEICRMFLFTKTWDRV